MEPINYFTLNQEQNFSFPHDDADVYTNEQLWTHYQGRNYLCVYLIKQLNPEANIYAALTTLNQQPYVKDYAAAWMRLKFLCEVMEPRRILHRCEGIHPKAKARLPILTTWTPELLTDNLYKVDVAANIIGLYLFDLVKSIVLATELPVKPVKEFTDAVLLFNEKLQAVRRNPLGARADFTQGDYHWNLWNPYDLAPFAFAKYIVDANDAFTCVSQVLPGAAESL
jgi:hypothetical protein